MSVLDGFIKTKKHRKLSDGYKAVSQWTSSQTVEMNDGNTLEDEMDKKLDTSGDTANNIVTFTSDDDTNPTSYTDVSLLESDETHANLFNKISSMFKNVRYIFSKLGDTNISSIGNGTITDAISKLNSGKVNQSTLINSWEFTGTGAHFLDFHYQGDTADYTSRIIEDTSGHFLFAANNGVTCTGALKTNTNLIANGTISVTGKATFGNEVAIGLPLTMAGASSSIKFNAGNITYASNAFYIDTNNGVHIRNYVGGSYVPIYASAFTTKSSKLIKENIQDISTEEASKILELHPITYDLKENFGGDKNQIGLIAEEVLEIIPSAVTVPENYNENNFDEEKGISQDILGIDYSKFTPYIIKLLQIQQEEIKELKAIINNKI